MISFYLFKYSISVLQPLQWRWNMRMSSQNKTYTKPQLKMMLELRKKLKKKQNKH